MIKKMASRKMLVFILTTIGMFMQIISERTWLYVALMYIGSQAIVDGLQYVGRKGKVGGELPDTDDER